MNAILYLFLFITFFFLACKSERRDIILKEKDLIPEGVAFNQTTNEVYIGCIYKQKIITIGSDEKVRTLFDQSFFNTLSPIGMEVENGQQLLWVCAAEAPIVNLSNTQKWNTVIFAFDLKNKSLHNKYSLEDGINQRFFNDLTIANNGDVFITESVESKIYTVQNNSNEIELFVDLDSFSFANGIVYYEPINCLFIATNQGLVRLEIDTKTYYLLENEAELRPLSVDGLAIYQNYFIAHQSSKISKFYFNDSLNKIVRSEIFATGDEFDSSTTGELGNGYYHFIVNSQIRSGINQSSKSIKPLDSLENVIIRKVKLN